MADISNNDVGSANSQFPAFGRFVDCADHCAFDLKLAPRTSQVTFSAPKFSRRNPDFSILVYQAMFAIASEKERAIKIDIIGAAREHPRRRHAQ